MIRQSYMQTLLVLATFALMVVSSYLYVSEIEHEHLVANIENILSSTQNSIEADLKEPRTTLASLSHTVRTMILQGCSASDIDEYFREVSDSILGNGKFMNGFAGFYGYFEAFDGLVTNGGKWKPPEDYDATERPWYKAAVEGNGEIVSTPLYFSAHTDSVVIAYVRRIFDDSGKPLGAMGLSVDFNRISDYVVKANFGDNGYGALIDPQMKIIAHPNSALVGTILRDSSLAYELQHKERISEREFYNYENVPSIIFFRKLANGWNLGVSTPKEEYHKSANNMIKFLSVLGILFAAMLSFLLHRVLRAYTKKAQEVEYSKKTIEKLENVLNEIDSMIYVNVPETGELLFVNSSMKEHYNFQGNPVGQPCYKVFQNGKEEKCDFCPCSQLEKEPGKIIRWEEFSDLTNRTYQNTDRYIEWPDGRIVHLQSSVDITDLIAAREQAVQASQIKSRFLAFMSHEIRTPMNTILGITEIQLQDETLPHHLKEAFQEVYNSGDLLLGIINDILDLSRIEADKMELNVAKYEVASLVSDTVHLNLMNNSKPIEFNVDVSEDTPSRLLGDELRIKQILNNLISNAFKYTDEGSIKLSVYAKKSESDAGTATLVVSVSDTGRGLTKEQVEKLFQEYTRFNTDTNRFIEGVGLGLNITQRLVNMMNGKIFVESEPRKGSTFTVHLPQGIVDSQVLGSGVVESISQFRMNISKQSKKSQILREPMPYGKVLIVDDVKSNLYVAKGLMLPYSLSIDTVSSGYEAIEKIKSGKVYDIVFMDHMMPEMDGIEAAKALRELGYAHPIVALTANAVVGQADIFLQNGFDAFLSKPIDIRQLNSVLNKYVHDKQPPEIIEMARKQNAMPPVQWNPAFDKEPSLLEYLLYDIREALSVIESTYKEMDSAINKNLPLFTIKAHAMKSALANMGDAETSRLAQILEKAGKLHDINTVKNKTEIFIGKLQSAMAEVEARKESMETTMNEDTAYLREQMQIIYDACISYNESIAIDALKALKKLLWKKETNAVLDKISEHILFSNFEEAANIIKDYDKTIA
jgi:signal transduction histidine kinase/response regulator RpfG family c-di-GMP phosphodiesterase